MKKIILIILSIITVFSFNTTLSAACKDKELNEWATKVESTFTLGSGDHLEDLGYSYFLSISPLRDDVYIKITDGEGNVADGETYAYGDNKTLYGVGCYTNLEEETYTIKVYGGENSKCKKELLKTLKYTVPRFNRLSKRAMCDFYPEHELCKPFTNITKNMTEQSFNKVMKEYDKEVRKGELTLTEKILKVLGYALFAIVPFAIITFIYIYKVKEFRKVERER